MQTLKTTLRNRLSGAERIAILAIGSDLRADDASGMVAAQDLTRAISKQKKQYPVKIFFGETAPENLTGEIKKYKPSHLVIIDTIDAGKAAGSIFLFKPEEISGGTSFSTHKMPAKVLVDYITASCGCRTTILGIQPKTVAFGKPISKSVLISAKKVACLLFEVIPS